MRETAPVLGETEAPSRAARIAGPGSVQAPGAVYPVRVGLFKRRRTSSAAGGSTPSEARSLTLAHFREFQASRPGVEAYIEPATRFDQTTMVLIARSGEWTRRRVPDPAAARDLARELAMPVYDVQLTGYPARMREWNSRHKPRRR